MTLTQALEFARELASGDYPRQQLDELLEYLRTTDRAEVEAFFGAYDDAIQELPDPGPVNPDFMERLHSLQRGEDPERKDDRPTGTLLSWAIGLAAMAAAVALGVWFWKPAHSVNTHLAQNLSKPSPASIVPGGNKAILTLSNGQQVALDSLQNGSITHQGGVRIIKLASGRLAYQGGEGSEPVYNTITTPKGGQYQVVLPDGSRVWLNAGSSLRFPTAFGGKDRSVDMTGEAYFEIAPDRAKPFTVKAPGHDIAVLGTHFDVNAYTDEDAFKTTLLEGSVRVGNSVLQPGEQVVAGTGGEIQVRKDVETDEVVAWKNGRFLFDNADIPTIMRQIARWYDVQIRYEGRVPQGHFTGMVPRNSSLDKVLKIFALSQIHFRIEGKQIIVVA